jgi:hypothetical protein
MDTGEFRESRFARALKTQSPARGYTCPYLGHEGRVFPNAEQLHDHGRLYHRTDFEGLSPRQGRDKFREIALNRNKGLAAEKAVARENKRDNQPLLSQQEYSVDRPHAYPGKQPYSSPQECLS